MTAGLPLMKNVLTPLAKSILIPLGLTVAASAKEEVIQKNVFRSSMTASIMSNKETEDIIEIVNFFEESVLMIKRVSGRTKNEAAEKKVDFSQCWIH